MKEPLYDLHKELEEMLYIIRDIGNAFGEISRRAYNNNTYITAKMLNFELWNLEQDLVCILNCIHISGMMIDEEGDSKLQFNLQKLSTKLLDEIASNVHLKVLNLNDICDNKRGWFNDVDYELIAMRNRRLLPLLADLGSCLNENFTMRDSCRK